MNATMGLERRKVIQAAFDEGSELVAHNYVQSATLSNHQFDIDTERQIIRDTLAVYKNVVGHPAQGWLSSSLRSTPNAHGIGRQPGLYPLESVRR